MRCAVDDEAFLVFGGRFRLAILAVPERAGPALGVECELARHLAVSVDLLLKFGNLAFGGRGSIRAGDEASDFETGDSGRYRI